MLSSFTFGGLRPDKHICPEKRSFSLVLGYCCSNAASWPRCHGLKWRIALQADSRVPGSAPERDTFQTSPSLCPGTLGPPRIHSFLGKGRETGGLARVNPHILSSWGLGYPIGQSETGAERSINMETKFTFSWGDKTWGKAQDRGKDGAMASFSFKIYFVLSLLVLLLLLILLSLCVAHAHHTQPAYRSQRTASSSLFPPLTAGPRDQTCSLSLFGKCFMHHWAILPASFYLILFWFLSFVRQGLSRGLASSSLCC